MKLYCEAVEFFIHESCSYFQIRLIHESCSYFQIQLIHESCSYFQIQLIHESCSYFQIQLIHESCSYFQIQLIYESCSYFQIRLIHESCSYFQIQLIHEDCSYFQIQLIHEAVEDDTAGNYTAAVKLYCEAVEFFIPAIKCKSKIFMCPIHIVADLDLIFMHIYGQFTLDFVIPIRPIRINLISIMLAFTLDKICRWIKLILCVLVDISLKFYAVPSQPT